MKSRSVPRRDNGTLLCLACCSERGRTRRGISPSGRDASLTLSMTLLSFRAYAKNLQLLLQEIPWGYSPQNDKCCYCLEGDSSSLTVVRMTCIFKGGSPLSFQARPVARRGISSFLLITVAIVLSLGGRFFKAKPFRMTLLREGCITE